MFEARTLSFNSSIIQFRHQPGIQKFAQPVCMLGIFIMILPSRYKVDGNFKNKSHHFSCPNPGDVFDTKYFLWYGSRATEPKANISIDLMANNRITDIQPQIRLSVI